MKKVQRTEYIGEYLGPVDWNFDFQSMQGGCSDPDHWKKQLERLKTLCNGEKWEATTYGGWPRCAWGEVLQIGMYDGWPYWKPVPSVLIASPYGGGEWASFMNITDIRKKDSK